MKALSNTVRSWDYTNPLVFMCCFGLVLFLLGSTIVLSLIPTYLPTRPFYEALLPTSKPQNILLELSSNTNLLSGTTLDISNQNIVQNQMQKALSNDQTSFGSSTIRILNATVTTFSRRKRRQTNTANNGLNVIYELVFHRSCTIRCQTKILSLARIKFVSLIITLQSSTSTASDDEVTGDITKISEYWANIRPYKDNAPTVFGVLDTGLPDECQVEQVHILHRHASRYFTTDAFDGGNILRFATKILSTNRNNFLGLLSFLKTWSLDISNDLLVPSGAADGYKSGVNFWNEYGRILYNAQSGQPYYNATNQIKPLVRTSNVQRCYETVLAWTSGFFGPYNTTDKYSLIKLSYDSGYNNTLYGALACRNLFIPSAFTFDQDAMYAYLAPVLANAANRFSSYTNLNLNFTHIDVFAMQSLCAYEYVALGSSDFCSLFTINEWRGYEQALNLAFYNTYGLGNETGRAQGIGYVQELIARLNHQLINISYSSVNSTLDSSETTFPLDQLFYLDMSHDNNIASVLAALSIDYFRENLSTIFPPPSNQHYRVSRMTPFTARLIIEKIGCTSSVPIAINSSHTEYSSSSVLKPYKFIRMKLNNGVLPLDTIRGGLCSIGRTDGLCPLDNFLASQNNASVMANFNYVCFGNYTIDSNTVITDGTLFA
ncbi:unnamed protein product [Adineta steineri]|uniref:3-phytase n=2 Tax=Adineta steineri TaxID=433720 RepID=A0A815JZN8_9BILA|nr:unnamed protein product [Adineta steineri]